MARCSKPGPSDRQHTRKLFFATANTIHMERTTIFNLRLLTKASLLISSLLLVSIFTFGQTVYVTNTGTKYHTSGCRYLSKSKIATSIDKALEGAYTACSVCKPSASSIKQGIIQNEGAPAKSPSSAQCSAMTKAGNRCSRSTKESNGKCWQHQ